VASACWRRLLACFKENPAHLYCMPILSLTASYVDEGNTLNLNLLWLFTKLQLLTAELGVAAIRSCGVTYSPRCHALR
jgi:hypothetical protein